MYKGLGSISRERGRKEGREGERREEGNKKKEKHL
jgi:hypothetical protein